MQQTQNPVVPSVAVASTPDSIGIVALDDQILAQVVGGTGASGDPAQDGSTVWLAVRAPAGRSRRLLVRAIALIKA